MTMRSDVGLTSGISLWTFLQQTVLKMLMIFICSFIHSTTSQSATVTKWSLQPLLPATMRLDNWLSTGHRFQLLLIIFMGAVSAKELGMAMVKYFVFFSGVMDFNTWNPKVLKAFGI